MTKEFLMNHAVRKDVIEMGAKLSQAFLIRSSEGNLSVRLDDSSFLISPSGSKLRDLIDADLVVVNFDGSHSTGQSPSSEWQFHKDIYLTKKNAQAVIHTHSDYATALACLREDLPAFHYMIAIAGGDVVRCSDYAIFGSEILSMNILSALEDRKACLIANHGLISWGTSLEEAFTIAREIEALCKQYFITRSAGAVSLLNEKEMREVIDKFTDYRANQKEFTRSRGSND
jgi:L-fuculose-phosphate aldolase